jgi:ubiquinone/menaquinone biosynthesis C-methylase UbiE
MSAAFDIAASTYDGDFTHTQIGSMQRNRVWKYLDQVLVNKTNLKVLELNCGTGEDAIRMARNGHQVLATDISEKMLDVAASKVKDEKITFLKLDLNKICDYSLDDDFDLVFSNFGGLNCIDSKSLTRFAESLSHILNKNGKFITVVMPQFCLWETLYFLLKGKMHDALRRKKPFVMANVSGQLVKTWYYSPSSFDSLMNTRMEVESVKPIGLFLPPSYLENFFRNNPKSLKLLNWLEERLAFYSWQARISDHFYIQYRMK